MALGKLPVPGRPTIWITVGQGPIVLAVGAGGGCLDIFTILYLFSSLSPSLWETARYRLKYCLKGPLNPKQPTNQDVTKLVLDFANRVNANVGPSDIDRAHRVGRSVSTYDGNERSSRRREIIIKFTNSSARLSLLKGLLNYEKIMSPTCS